ncbi:MAG: hypothetical protein B6A08_19080 [Sorangiineae bacterium NIC37A_2]|nr:MAG: hypothetical protein B6A08_19080 [Sorangiineae bacterium NIC37A_2]
MGRRVSKRSPNLVAADAVSRIYDLTIDTNTWFSEIVAMVRSVSDRGHGALGTIFHWSNFAVVHHELDGAHPKNSEVLPRGTPNPSVWSTSARFASSRVLFTLSRASSFLASPFWSGLTPLLREISVKDCVAFLGSDGVGTAIGFGAPSGVHRPELLLPERYFTQCVLPHVGTAFRLRRALTGLDLDTESVEAIFSDEGRCLYAQGMAQERSARTLLHAAVRYRVNGRKPGSDRHRPSPRDWLLEGRWSLIDRYEENGRHYVVAYRNPVGILDPRRLSGREREVVARIAQGMSQKIVAVELGVKESTVATIAHKVVRKLGLRSTREIPLFWRDLDGTPTSLNSASLEPPKIHPSPRRK